MPTKEQRARMGAVVGRVTAEWAAEQAGRVTPDPVWSAAEPSQYHEHADVLSASDSAQADLLRRTREALKEEGIEVKVLGGEPGATPRGQAALSAIERVAAFYVRPPKDADSDGFIDDGLPTERPNPLDAQDWAPATDEERKALKIPNGWTEVEVNRAPGARLLARGRDAAGRRQPKYSQAHTEAQAAAKFARMRALDAAIPDLDVALKGDDSDTSKCLRLIRAMGLRPGNTQDQKAKVQAYGATTLLSEHVVVGDDGGVRLTFTGKKGVSIDLPVEDPEVADMLREQVAGRAPGEQVFPGTNERKTNLMLKDLTGGQDFKVKDLRTYLANQIALEVMAGMDPPTNMSEFRRLRKAVAVAVSARLGNTPDMALSSYINPAVFADWEADINAGDFEKGLNDV
jgi:DNA topoisomerase-1